MSLTPPLSMLQLQPDVPALLRFLAGQGHVHTADSDLGYGVHAWLAATFGKLAPRPFRLYLDGTTRKPPKLLAYTHHSRDSLLEHAQSFAEPAARAVCALDDHLTLAELPGPDAWRPGRRLGFEVLACPVARRARDGVERDWFLHQADYAGPDSRLDRATTYGEWLAIRFQSAATLESANLTRFQFVSLMRQSSASGHRQRQRSQLIRPAALLQGVLHIQDGDRFQSLLANGVGRHGAFGYGMLLLRPT